MRLRAREQERAREGERERGKGKQRLLGKRAEENDGVMELPLTVGRRAVPCLEACVPRSAE